MSTLYAQSAAVLGKVLGKTSSAKTAIYQDAAITNKKAVLAVVTKTLQNIETLRQVVDATPAFAAVKNRNLLLVMLNDLMTTGKDSGGGSIKQLLLKEKDALPPLAAAPAPEAKYYRHNTLVASYFPSIESEAVADPDIPDVYRIAPPLRHDSALLIAQDKPSCFPAFVLQPRKKAWVIDACAAPGNKTTHLAQLMRNTGRIFAFDKDPKRMETLRATVERCKATNIETLCQDFLTADPADPKFARVEFVLCDPSCSGSGLLDRHGLNERASKHRLRMLSSFQKRIVLHAMQFPNVKRVTYSTCSVHTEENEMVVRAILRENTAFELAEALPSWHRRGIAIDDEAPYERCVRVDPDQDHMTGFFVALFVRKTD